MRAKFPAVTLAVMLFAAAPRAASQDEFRQFQGVWAGSSGATELELYIGATGQVDWVASIGNARGEGNAALRRDGSDYVVSVSFLQPAPLRLQLSEAGKALNVSGRAGTRLVLHLKS
jgi:hypothetical protein